MTKKLIKWLKSDIGRLHIARIARSLLNSSKFALLFLVARFYGFDITVLVGVQLALIYLVLSHFEARLELKIAVYYAIIYGT